jgi:asparagine synthase (glutamine-hydrolysing)
MIQHIPQGGFLALKDNNINIEDINSELEQQGARTEILPGSNLILAAFEEFCGQGIWSGRQGYIAYDLDLTNQSELRALAGWSNQESFDQGELLITLYYRFGLGFIDRLRGQFAFALWDSKEAQLIIVTDPYGMRPVVYHQLSEGLVAASRIRQILIHPSVTTGINPEAIYHYLYFSAIPSPASIYKRIHKLEPGKGLIYKNDSLTRFTHYDIRYEPNHSYDVIHWLKHIPQAIEKAMANFVPLSEYSETGCFLSGGTDSSTVAGYYTALTGEPAKTFSIGFNEDKYNELSYAHIAAHHFGTRQHDYYITPEDVLKVVDYLCQIYDEPFGNSSVVPAYFCGKLAKENGVHVLLGGDGGDEIFGGNERYVKNLIFGLYHEFPGFFRKKILEPLIRFLPNIHPVHRANRYIRRANIPNPERFFSYNLLAERDSANVFCPEFLSQIDTACFMDLVRSLYDQVAYAQDTDKLLYIDMKLTITDNDLRKVSRMLELEGVRARYPLLDRDLVDFTASIPPNLKVKMGKNRYIFKRAMDRFLPDEIIKKKKHGMGLPIALWFKKDSALSAFLNDTLFSQQPRITQFVRPSFLNEMKAAFETDTTPYYGDNLWVFAVLELWLRQTNK